MLNHATWRASNQWAVFAEKDTGSLYQLWTGGAVAKLLDLRVSSEGLGSTEGYYRISSFPNLSRNGAMLLYSSDGGHADRPVGIFLAFLENADAGYPFIDHFEATPVTVASSFPTVTLRWATQHASMVQITPGPGPVPNSGSTTVRPTSDTEYELIADGPKGQTRAKVLVQVRQQPMESLIVNGSMEVGSIGDVPSGWNPTRSAALTRDTAHDFSSSVRLTGNSTTRTQGKLGAPVPVEHAFSAQGKRVALKVWLRSAVGRAIRGGSLQIHYGDPVTTHLMPIDDLIGQSWQPFETSVVLPRNISGRLAVAVEAVGPWEDSSAFLDEVSLRIVEAPDPPLIDDFRIVATPSDGSGTLAIRWQARRATSLTLMPQGIKLLPTETGTWVFGGDYPVPPRGTTLRLVAQGLGGSATAETVLMASTESPGLPPPSAPSLEPAATSP